MSSPSEKASPQGILRPATPGSSKRYDNNAPRSAVSHQTVLPGLFVDEPLAASHWSQYTHPEGSTYFHRDSLFSVVTEACIQDPVTLLYVDFWLNKVEQLVYRNQIKISQQMELCLVIDGEDCGYYFIDRVSKTAFWADPVSTEELELPAVLSPSHLKSFFWQHIEYFPMHFGGLVTKDVDQLLCIFSHNLTDKLTSTSSTALYDKETCANFLKLLKSARDHVSDGHQTCLVARLWYLTMLHRTTVQYGTAHCRLDRHQAILGDAPSEVSALTSAFSRLSFRTYDAHLDRVKKQYVDRLVYEEHWKQFVSENLVEWRDVAYLALSSLMMHVLCFFTEASVVLGAMSFALSGASFLSSVFLLHRYKQLRYASSTEAYEHLANLESTKFGLQFVALAFCLPFTFYSWGLAVFIVNCIYVLIQFDTQLALWIGAFFILGVMAFHRMTSKAFPSSFSLSPSSFSLAFRVPFFTRRGLDLPV
ncbi:hypothetical protein C8J56DRAFT_267598 [Mycena floridula]|nr:hypothetical protein C8J56DRAFT_267598 [Mycena floridula]